MCGIAGVLNLDSSAPPVERRVLERMISAVRHRGPDGYGFHAANEVGLAHARLSIIDLEGGWQPIYNEDRTLAVVFNGEIFNYVELRKELEDRGHRFTTKSDTEVIVHLYEEKRERCVEDLNGQFAIALYDTRNRSLFLARDRLGIRPLYYAFHRGRFFFGSEVKALFAADATFPREIAPEIVAEVFAFWMPVGRETAFKGVSQLGAGHWARVSRRGGFQEGEYWDVPFDRIEGRGSRAVEDYAEELRELLVDAVRLQLRADVPVGAYLSGGLDSSAITSLVRNFTSNELKTFSVTFSDEVYDESVPQREVAEYLKTDHHSVHCTYGTIAEAFPHVVRHAEAPLLRTAPTPLYLLSGLVRKNDYRVVLTGEGSDEVLCGYDLFKEAKVRRFVAKNPDSAFRGLLFKRLYPYLALSPMESASYAKRFFDVEAPIDDPFYAHRPRWKATDFARGFFSEAVSQTVGSRPEEKIRAEFAASLEGLDYLSRAQYLETKTLLANYLLSSQGDRVAMAHSVEGRFPFLDHRVVEFACRIPATLRMKVLDEKHVLKQALSGLLPASVLRRKKQPYMAPDILSFFGEKEPEYLAHYLSGDLLKEAGLFNEKAVQQLLTKCRKSRRQGFRENMVFVGVLSTQILYDEFVRNMCSSRSVDGTTLETHVPDRIGLA
ncbi:MAG: asparagine synthase (glutamine-hydrolyzing) [Deltaproteobacteria bacterium]|nr:asparagine synthase (glutamine-hydrolyzing) [Deltaproteobacteria bacterium]